MHLEQSKNISFILKEFHKITYFSEAGPRRGGRGKIAPGPQGLTLNTSKFGGSH